MDFKTASQKQIFDECVDCKLVDLPMEIRDKMLKSSAMKEITNDFIGQVAANNNKFSENIGVPTEYRDIPEKIQRRMTNLLYYFLFFESEKKLEKRGLRMNHIHAFMDISLWLESHYHIKREGPKYGMPMMRRMELGYDDKEAYAMNHLLQVTEMAIGGIDMLKKTGKMSDNPEFNNLSDNPFEFLLVCLLHDSTEDGDKLFQEITPEVLTEKLNAVFTEYHIESSSKCIVDFVERLSFHNVVVNYEEVLGDKNITYVESQLMEAGYPENTVKLLGEKYLNGRMIEPTQEGVEKMIRIHADTYGLYGKKVKEIATILLPAAKNIESSRKAKYTADKKESFYLSLVKTFDILHNACSVHKSTNQFDKYENHYIPFVCEFLAKNKLQLTDIIPETRIYEIFENNKYLFDIFKKNTKQFSTEEHTLVVSNPYVRLKIRNHFSMPPHLTEPYSNQKPFSKKIKDWLEEKRYDFFPEIGHNRLRFL